MSRFGFDATQWARLSPLLDEALDQPADQRERWLSALPADVADLREVLADLLGGADAAPPTLPALERDEPDTHRAGECIGPYRLLRPLGQGGMGSVWLARRSDGVLQRPVALKMPRLTPARTPGGAAGGHLAERLARERDLLAGLEHASIARLYDAGLDDSGQPYLALEFVEGLRIDAHCDAHQLDLGARLRLFLQAVRAVAHAHAHLVVHRDLKPANLLVDSAGQLKLLDFGIARLLDEGAATPSELTREGGRPMTREYASPEQVAGQPVGTASDVYSLGVVLYQLLTGSRPYRPARDSAAALEEAIVCAEPPRPSVVAGDPARRRALRGDLDTIVLQALKKAPNERYATADALAEDIERYLGHRPIQARADSLGYVLRKLWARHTAALTAAGVAVATVLGSAVLALWLAQRADAERQRAADVKDFVTALLRDASPYYAGDVSEVTTRQLLQQARQRLQKSAPLRADVRAELEAIVGEALMSFGDLEGAEALVSAAVQTARRELGEDHRETTRARLVQAQVLRLRGRGKELQQALDELMPVVRRHGDSDPEALVLGLTNQALLVQDRGAYAEAVRLAEEAASLAAQRLPATHPERIGAANLLALTYRMNGRPADARDAAARALAMIAQAHGDEPHPRRLEALGVHGRALADLGDLDGGSRQIEAAIAEGTRMYGADHLTVGVLQQNVVAYHLDRGDLDAAERRSAEALRVIRKHTQPDSYMQAVTAMTRGLVLLERLQAGPALLLLDPAATVLDKTVGPSHDLALAAHAHQALALAALGRIDSAAAIVAPLPGRAASAAPHVRLRVGLAEARLRRHQGATDLAQAALQPWVETPPANPRARHERLRALTELGWVHQSRADAAQARRCWQDALAEAGKLESIASPTQAQAQLGLGLLDLAEGRPAAALPHLQQAEAVLARQAPGSPLAAEVSRALAHARALPVGRTPVAR